MPLPEHARGAPARWTCGRPNAHASCPTRFWAGSPFAATPALDVTTRPQAAIMAYDCRYAQPAGDPRILSLSYEPRWRLGGSSRSLVRMLYFGLWDLRRARATFISSTIFEWVSRVLGTPNAIGFAPALYLNDQDGSMPSSASSPLRPVFNELGERVAYFHISAWPSPSG